MRKTTKHNILFKAYDTYNHMTVDAVYIKAQWDKFNKQK